MAVRRVYRIIEEVIFVRSVHNRRFELSPLNLTTRIDRRAGSEIAYSYP
jgi:hypothetical protein